MLFFLVKILCKKKIQSYVNHILVQVTKYKLCPFWNLKSYKDKNSMEKAWILIYSNLQIKLVRHGLKISPV